MKTSTLSSANFAEGNTLIKERTQTINNKIIIIIIIIITEIFRVA